MRVVVVRTYLLMRTPEDADLSFPEIPGLAVRAVEPQDIAAYREAFNDVGEEVLWIGRCDWRDEEFAELLGQDQVKAWLARLDGVPAGFFEFKLEADGSVQLVHIGVRPRFRGRGLGKYLVSFFTERAWDLKPTSVWLYTHTVDAPHALDNYVRRGYRIWKRRAAILTVPDSLAPRVHQRMELARSAGVAPGFLRHVEAHLRESLPGRAARRVVWEIKRAFRSLAKVPVA